MTVAMHIIHCLYILGRIHSANVSGVDFVGQNVTVEWFEFGETKGKEVSCNLAWKLGTVAQGIFLVFHHSL